MRNLIFCIIFGMVTATAAYADVDISALPDLGTPATATDSIVTYDSSAVAGSRLTEKKFTGTSDESLRGDGTMPDHGIMGHEGIQFDITGTPPTAHSEGKFGWNDDDKTIEIHTEVSDVKLQVGQEMFLRSTNSTGSTLSNGDIVYVSGALGSRPQITLSDADIELTTKRTIGMVTSDILNNNTGYVTIFGLVRDVDTSSGSDGDPIYVSSTAGGWQTTVPAHPAHEMRIGYIVYSHATEGIILVSTQKGGHLANLWEVDISSPADKEVLAYDNASSTWINSAVDSAFFDFYNGTLQESFDALVTSDGTTITLSLQSGTAGDLTMRFSDGLTNLDCTPAKTITLTVGTDNSPQSNYIYIPQSTKVLTKSTTNWPSTEHIRIGYFYVQSAVTVQSNGAMINQNWNDEAASDNNQGHVTHLGAWIRSVGAKWFSGCDGGGTNGYLTPYAGGASIQVNAGVISQTHKHTYPSHDTSGTDVALAYNYPSDAWKEVDDINDMLVDSTGASLTNRYYNIIIGGVANKGGEYSPLVVKLPSGSYNSSSTAINDTSNYTDYAMPREFNKESSTGFLIARITIRNQSDTTFTVMNTQDLRGQDGAVAAGSIGGTALTDFADSQFTIYNNIDATKVIDFLASAITTGNTRTITMADVDIDLADIVTNNAKIGLSNDAVTPNYVLSTGQTDEYCLTYEATGTTWEWQVCGGGAGDMLASTYDPATIAEQLVGLTATQTLTNKTLTSPNINEAVAVTSTATELNLLDGITVLSGSNTGDEVAATTTVAGIAELATSADVVTGTETDTIVTPDTLTDKMAAPGAIGGTTASPGDFTTVGASTSVTSPIYYSSAADGSRYQTYPNNTTGNEPGHATVVNGFYSFENVLYMVENSVDGYAMIDSNDIGTTVHAEDDGAFTGAVSGTAGTFSGNLTGLLETATDADAHTLTSAEYHGGTVLATGAGIYTLPTAAAGLSGCVEAGQGVTAIIQLLPASGDYIVHEGARGTAATSIKSDGSAGDRICYRTYNADDWYVSTFGTWAE